MKNDLDHLQSPFLDEVIAEGLAPRSWDPDQPGLTTGEAGDDEIEAHECHAGCAHHHGADEAEDEDLQAGDDEAPGCAGDHEFDDLEAEFFDREAWSGSAEQLAFRDRVLAAHLAATRRRRGPPQRDLDSRERERVPGTQVEMRSDAAAAAGRLLAAANADLAEAQQAGDADARRTLRLSATSGYRASAHQNRLWLKYFAGYYKRTRSKREKLAAGPHSDEAVDHMLKPRAAGGFGLGGRIAAPGYSNHQNGIAIDFLQERRKGHEVPNESDDGSRAKWRASWFHHWLQAHAAEHGFQPIATEEWHWEFRGSAAAPAVRKPTPATAPAPKVPQPAAEGGPAVAYLGGKLWTFQDGVVHTKVAVFCPPAALGRRDVDVLLYAHGLLNGCERPHSLPDGMVTGSPFHLGNVVAQSSRPIVLVVPLLDWNKPGGAAAFGASHPRWHALAQPAHLNALIDEVLTELGRVQSTAPPTLDHLVIAGHSRAYDFLEPLAHLHDDPQMQQGALAKLSQVWALDTTYAGSVPRWQAWLAANPRLRVSMFYRQVKGTEAVGDSFYKARGGRLSVARASEGHCAVPGRRLPGLLKPADDDSAAVQQEFEDSWGHGESFADDLLLDADRYEPGDEMSAEAEDLVDDALHEADDEYLPDDKSEEDEAHDDFELDDESFEAGIDASGEGGQDEAEAEDEQDSEWSSESDFEFEDETHAEQALEEEETGDKTPMALPADNPVPFAPLPPAGSHWPVGTRHKSARLVSYMYQAPSGIVGASGRMFLAGRKGKVRGRTVGRWHVGLDLFASRNDVVVACEAGTIVGFSHFYKARSGQSTYKLLIEHEGSGIVVNYGELRQDSLRRNGLQVGSRVSAGQPIGFVSDTDMVHFETYVKGTTESHRWWKAEKNPPHELLNPTRYLLALAKTGLGQGARAPASPADAPPKPPDAPPAAAPASPAPGRLPTLSGLGAGHTPPSDPGAYRTFRLTTYHVVNQEDEPTGAVRIPILDDQGRTLAECSPAFFAKLSLEGSGRLTDGRLVNVTGHTVTASHDDYAPVLEHHRKAYAKGDARRIAHGKKPAPTLYSGIVTQGGRVVRAMSFHEIDKARRGVGYGVAHRVAYTPFRTLAADIGTEKYSKVDPRWKGKGGLVPSGTQVYIKEYDGLQLPDGSTHDGWFVVNDTGGAIFGAHFDVFTGTDALRRQVRLPAVGQVWFPGIEQRIPAGYTYGLEK